MSHIARCFYCGADVLCFWRHGHHICVDCTLLHRDEPTAA